MKKFVPIAKMFILTFCLMIFLLNIHHVLRADEYHCSDGPSWICEQKVLPSECFDECDAIEEECWFFEWSSGYCDGILCMQWWDIYCTSGFLDSFEYECAGYGCIFK